MPYLIHWTSRRPADLVEYPGAQAVGSTTRVEDEPSLIGFLLDLPGDETFTVRGLSEVS